MIILVTDQYYCLGLIVLSVPASVQLSLASFPTRQRHIRWEEGGPKDTLPINQEEFNLTAQAASPPSPLHPPPPPPPSPLRISKSASPPSWQPTFFSFWQPMKSLWNFRKLLTAARRREGGGGWRGGKGRRWGWSLFPLCTSTESSDSTLRHLGFCWEKHLLINFFFLLCRNVPFIWNCFWCYMVIIR